MSSLMARIKVISFLDLSHEEQFGMIRNVQLLRAKALKEAPKKKKKKVAKKKAAVKKKTMTKKVMSTLDGMTIEQLMALAEKHKIQLNK